MIGVISRPENLSAAFLPVAYGVSASSSDESFDVEIYDGDFDECLGIKRYLGEQNYTVELGDYLRYRFDIEPISGPKCELFEDESKLKAVGVKIDGIFETSPSWHTFATVNVEGLEALSSAPLSRKITWGQRDELSILVVDSALSARYSFSGEVEDFVIELDALSAENKVVSLLTDMVTLKAYLQENELDADLFSALKLEIFANDEVILEINYSLESEAEDEFRLCWLNKYGALDYYTFSGNVLGYCQVSKQRVYSSSGYKVTGSSLSRMMNLYTDFLPNKTLEWLSELLASAKVWIVEGDDFQLIDVLSDSLVYKDEDLLRLELSVRNAQSEVYQYV
ncbi:MAG: hypothetical protein R3Y38_05810 [Rikenellaceae bacterium]